MTTDSDDDELMTVSEVALQLKLHPETIRRWAREGKLPPADVPGRQLRFWRSEVLRREGWRRKR
jgi:excisionase family DNA binding protein